MRDNPEISVAASSSGTRTCFKCGLVIKHQTVIIKGESQEIVFHEPCLRVFTIKVKNWAFRNDDR